METHDEKLRRALLSAAESLSEGDLIEVVSLIRQRQANSGEELQRLLQFMAAMLATEEVETFLEVFEEDLRNGTMDIDELQKARDDIESVCYTDGPDRVRLERI